MSVVELKALVFDNLVIIENSQKNIQLINAEIAKRVEQPNVINLSAPTSEITNETPKTDE